MLLQMNRCAIDVRRQEAMYKSRFLYQQKVEQHKMKIDGFEFALEKSFALTVSTFANSAKGWAA